MGRGMRLYPFRPSWAWFGRFRAQAQSPQPSAPPSPSPEIIPNQPPGWAKAIKAHSLGTLAATSLLAAVLCASAGCGMLESSPDPQPASSQQEQVQQPAGEWQGPELVDLPDTVGGVNFVKLKKQNDDVIGWIRIKDTNVNYPVLQSGDNDYYLHRGMDKQKLYAGSVYADFRCDPWLHDYNTVLYGHHMADGSMFRDIARYIDPAYLKKHSKIAYIARDKVHKLKPFYVWAEKANIGMNRTSFRSLEEFRAYWKKRLKGEKLYNGVKLKKLKHIWTFYTCSYQGDNFRTVVLAAEL